MKPLLAFAVLVCALSAGAQSRFVTIANDSTLTNSLEIVSGETAQLVSLVQQQASQNANTDILSVERDGLRWTWRPTANYVGPVRDPLIVTGPARFHLSADGFAGSVCTFRITPDAIDPTTTVVIPPGPGGGVVTLECSTNLVNWQTATNGIYTNQPVAKFFRIKLDRITPN